MRCPKCHYVSFDGQSRCRNCGYDFSLAQPAPDPELPTRTESAATPLADLSLKVDPPPGDAAGGTDTPTLVDRYMPPQPTTASPAGGPRTGAARAPARAENPQTDPIDLPLFNSGAPRAPLSVRRPTGEGPRVRPRVTPQAATPPRIEEPRLDLGLPDVAEPDLGELEIGSVSQRPQARDVAANIVSSRAAASRSIPSRDATAPGAPAIANDPAIEADLAPLGTRIAAGLIDLAFILAVDAVVLHFTLRVTGLPLSEWRRLPVAPLVVFLTLLNGGYLTMFTAASGQTMGKMLLNLRVVASRGGPVPFGSAALRAVVWLLTILPFGVGFIPAVLAADRRALHDRFADTKVITVSE